MVKSLLLLAGAGQIALAVGSLAIPRLLRWPEDLAKLRPLTRQVFWTYAGYIWCTNMSFGLLSLLAPAALCDGSVLAAAVTGFITAYWLARLIIQFAWFDRSARPPGLAFRCAEFGLATLFVIFTGVYGWTLAVNLGVVAS